MPKRSKKTLSDGYLKKFMDALHVRLSALFMVNYGFLENSMFELPPDLAGYLIKEQEFALEIKSPKLTKSFHVNICLKNTYTLEPLIHIVFNMLQFEVERQSEIITNARNMQNPNYVLPMRDLLKQLSHIKITENDIFAANQLFKCKISLREISPKLKEVVEQKSFLKGIPNNSSQKKLKRINVMINQALAFLNQENGDSACEQLKKALELDKENPIASFLLNYILYPKFEFEDVSRMVTYWNQHQGVLTAVILSIAYAKKESMSLSISYANFVLEHLKDDMASIQSITRVLYEHNCLQLCLYYLEGALKASPENKSFLAMRGRVQSQQYCHELGHQDLHKALGLEAKDAKIIVTEENVDDVIDYASALCCIQKLPESIAAYKIVLAFLFKQKISNKPDKKMSEEGSKEEINIKTFFNTLTYCVEDKERLSSVYGKLALAYKQSNDLVQSRSAYEKATSIKFTFENCSNYAVVLCHLATNPQEPKKEAYLKEALKQVHEGLRFLGKMKSTYIAFKGTSLTTMIYHGIIHLYLGEKENALDSLNLACSIYHDKANAYGQCAATLAHHRFHSVANDYFVKALTLKQDEEWKQAYEASKAIAQRPGSEQQIPNKAQVEKCQTLVSMELVNACGMFKTKPPMKQDQKGGTAKQQLLALFYL